MECGICKKQFVRYSDLRKHAKRFHRDAVEEIAPLKRTQRQYKFQCGCGKNFNHKKNLNAHSRSCSSQSSYPNTNVVNSSKNIRLKKCPLCEYENLFQNNFYSHFLHAHNVKIIEKSLSFKTFEEFGFWKSSTENETKSRFIKYRGHAKKEPRTKIYYHCHRSGYFKSESKGIRRIKTQGSNKINGFCPAKIEVVLNENGQCNVRFVETHIGHDTNDLGHLFLTDSERQELAVKIASNIPIPAILENIRDKDSNELNRLDLVTRKDLYNIKAAFNRKSEAVRHKNDAISVDAWVSEMEEGNHQDSDLEDYPELKANDFVLCIVNEGQCQVFKKFAIDGGCIDETHSLNSYHFDPNKEEAMSLTESLTNDSNLQENKQTGGCIDGTLGLNSYHFDPTKEEAMTLTESFTNDSTLQENNSIAYEKEKIIQHLISVINNITTIEQVEALKKLIAPIEAAISAVVNTEN